MRASRSLSLPIYWRRGRSRKLASSFRLSRQRHRRRPKVSTRIGLGLGLGSGLGLRSGSGLGLSSRQAKGLDQNRNPNYNHKPNRNCGPNPTALGTRIAALRPYLWPNPPYSTRRWLRLLHPSSFLTLLLLFNRYLKFISLCPARILTNLLLTLSPPYPRPLHPITPTLTLSS